MTETISVTRKVDGTFRAVHRQHGWKTTGESKADALLEMAELLKSYEFDADDDDFLTVGDSAYSITSTLVDEDEV